MGADLTTLAGRLPLVREAVAWVLVREGRRHGESRPWLPRLLDMYSDGHQNRDEPVQQSFEANVLRGLDAPQLALDLHHHLDPDLRRVDALRASGAELKAIAEDQQVAISTAHQRVATAVKRIRRQVRRRRVGPDTLRPLIAALSE